MIRSLVAGVLVASFALAGCSGEDASPDAKATPSLSASPTASGTPTAAPSPGERSTSGKPSARDRTNVALTKVRCTFTDGSWSFTARLTNEREQPLDYRVRVVVVAAEGGTVAGQHLIERSVPAGDSVSLAAPAFHRGDRSGHRCLASAAIATD